MRLVSGQNKLPRQNYELWGLFRVKTSYQDKTVNCGACFGAKQVIKTKLWSVRVVSGQNKLSRQNYELWGLFRVKTSYQDKTLNCEGCFGSKQVIKTKLWTVRVVSGQNKLSRQNSELWDHFFNFLLLINSTIARLSMVCWFLART